MRSVCYLDVALTCLVLNASAGAADFWLSANALTTSGPSNVAVSPSIGASTTLYVWGRPESGRQFDAVSLNVVATGAEIDFVDGSYVFYNAIDGSTDRFEFVVDSSTVPTLASEYSAFELGLGGVTDGLYGLNGFNLTDTSPRGMGPVCSAGEMHCVIASDGSPAWLIASFQVSAIAAGVVDLHLQIGDRGVAERTLAPGDYDLEGEVAMPDHAVWAAGYGAKGIHAADGNLDGVVNAADYTIWRDHVGDSSVLLGVSATEVRFGADAMAGDEPAHNALTDREINLPGDDADATFTIAAPAQSVPEPAADLLTAVALTLPISNGRRRPTGRSR
ncbi:hypothetical protein Pla108_13060 [Botrimarina colliarenosi]|uniref:Dockerin domain-containing protein n=1 Tax=Botrimarina colliarenosi TaxID=2528001 RepID=A0A5C6ALM0_9BACT|nr:hypothetical protein [Botrimarina colliarenosi]TWU00357.1 hypothetical protein Pla108_13060 [Botrimarina colliarenosi]